MALLDKGCWGQDLFSDLTLSDTLTFPCSQTGPRGSRMGASGMPGLGDSAPVRHLLSSTALGRGGRCGSHAFGENTALPGLPQGRPAGTHGWAFIPAPRRGPSAGCPGSRGCGALCGITCSPAGSRPPPKGPGKRRSASRAASVHPRAQPGTRSLLPSVATPAHFPGSPRSGPLVTPVPTRPLGRSPHLVTAHPCTCTLEPVRSTWAEAPTALECTRSRVAATGHGRVSCARTRSLESGSSRTRSGRVSRAAVRRHTRVLCRVEPALCRHNRHRAPSGRGRGCGTSLPPFPPCNWAEDRLVRWSKGPTGPPGHRGDRASPLLSALAPASPPAPGVLAQQRVSPVLCLPRLPRCRGRAGVCA